MQRQRRHCAILASLFLFSRTCSGCTVFQFGQAGFASATRSLLVMYAAYGSNGSFIIDSQWFPYKCAEMGADAGGWHEFFSSPGTLAWAPGVEEAQPDGPCAWYWHPAVDQTMTELQLPRHELEAEAIKPVWQLQPHVQRVVDAELQRLAAAEGPTIAFHVRGGDKLAEDVSAKRETTWAFNYLQRFVKTYPDLKGGTCVVLGDEHAFVQEVTQLAVKVLGCTPFQRQGYVSQGGHKQVTFNQLPPDVRCQSSMQLIVDLELLAHADYFIGTWNSGMAHLVDVLRYKVYGKSRETIVDASWAQGDFYSQSRKYLQRDREARGVPEPPTPHLDEAEAEHKGKLASQTAMRDARLKADKDQWQNYWVEETKRRQAASAAGQS